LLFYHIYQMAALNTRLLVGSVFATAILWEGEVIEGQRWYHSKERWWFPIGCQLWPLCYL